MFEKPTKVLMKELEAEKDVKISMTNLIRILLLEEFKRRAIEYDLNS